jgi:hypothetical protein
LWKGLNFRANSPRKIEQSIHPKRETVRLFDFAHTITVQSGDQSSQLNFLHSLDVVQVGHAHHFNAIVFWRERDFRRDIANRRGQWNYRDTGQKT